MVFAALYLGWFSVYVMVVERLGRLLRRPSIKARIERVTGLPPSEPNAARVSEREEGEMMSR
jgi:hypothetical protein